MITLLVVVAGDAVTVGEVVTTDSAVVTTGSSISSPHSFVAGGSVIIASVVVSVGVTVIPTSPLMDILQDAREISAHIATSKKSALELNLIRISPFM